MNENGRPTRERPCHFFLTGWVPEDKAYFFSPQTYELISAPSGISVTFGAFQAMIFLLVYDDRQKHGPHMHPPAMLMI